ncbi:E3 ubiquitin-protein ligase [Aphelenchoides fujianensis]|nr:E3 ubiquitin-protein ligase [Aphelenchoides fujianensis]
MEEMETSSAEQEARRTEAVQTAANLRQVAVRLKQNAKPGQPWMFVCSEDEKINLVQAHYLTTLGLMETRHRDNTLTLMLNAENAKTLIAGGRNYADFLREMKQYDFATTCSAVWVTNVLAFRCATCALNPCVSLASLPPITRATTPAASSSSSGGRCDCGDSSVCKPEGFCPRHKEHKEKISPPAELTALPEFVITKVLLRILNEFRSYEKMKESDHDTRSSHCSTEFISKILVQGIDGFVELLQELANESTAFLDIIADLLLDRNVYDILRKQPLAHHEDKLSVAELHMLRQKPTPVDPMPRLPKPPHLDDFEFLPTEPLQFWCLLDEFIWSAIRLGFPQRLINFPPVPAVQRGVQATLHASVLSVRYDQLEGLMSELMLGRRAAHRHARARSCLPLRAACVTLEREIDVCRRLTESLVRFFYFRSTALPPIGRNSTAQLLDWGAEEEPNPHEWRVLDVDQNVFFIKRGLWGATTDFQNFCVHKELADELLTDNELSHRYASDSELSASCFEFSGPTLNGASHSATTWSSRKSQRSNAAFTTEWEVSSSFCLNCISTMKQGGRRETSAVFFAAHNPLGLYLDSNVLASFALLHFLLQGEGLVIPTDSQEFLEQLFSYPLRIQAVIAECQASMWIRSGQQMRASIIDYDFSLMRIVASKMDPERVLELLFRAFHLQECIDYPFDKEEWESDRLERPTVERRAWIPFLVDGFLKLLLELVLVRSFAELTPEEEMRFEIVQTIITEDEPFERLLNEVASFIEPDQNGVMRQGHYRLKPEAWLTSVDLACNPREFNTILTRMEQELAHTMPHPEESRKNIWPLYCLPDFDRDHSRPTLDTTRLLPTATALRVGILTSDQPALLLQQAIFLLSLALRFVTSKRAERMEWTAGDAMDEEAGTGPAAAFYAHFHERPPAAKVFLAEASTHTPTAGHRRLKQKCEEPLDRMDRMVGTGSDYVARTIAHLYQHGLFAAIPVTKSFLETAVFPLAAEADESTASEQQKRRMAAKQKQLEFLKQQKLKQSALLKKFEVSEGIEAKKEEEEHTDPHLDLECAICNRREHGTATNWFGLLVYVQHTSVTAGSTTQEGVSSLEWEEEAVPAYLEQREQNAGIFSLLPHIEPKTCGHYAHVQCFENYQHANLHGNQHSLPVDCPLCRASVIGIVPLAPPSTSTTPVAPSGLSLDYALFDECFEHTRTVDHPTGSFSHCSFFFIRLVRRKESDVSTMLTSCFHYLEVKMARLIKYRHMNWIDRLCLMELEGIEFPDRLRQKIANANRRLLPQLLGRPHEAERLFQRQPPPLLHYDPKTLITIMSAELFFVQRAPADRLKFFQHFFSIALVQCVCRRLVFHLLSIGPSRRSKMVDEICSAIDGDAHGLSKAIEALRVDLEGANVYEALFNWPSDEEPSAARFVQTLRTELFELAHFSFNLGVEIEVLPLRTGKWNLHELGTNIDGFCEAILGQTVRFDELLAFAQGGHDQIYTWIASFLADFKDTDHVYYRGQGPLTFRKLVPLPHEYDTIFNEFFNRPCEKCNTVPQNPMICVVCKQLLCLDACCNSRYSNANHLVSEVESHAYACCSGSAIFLDLTSSMIVLYHNGLTCIFGSLLPRHAGKSLFLSQWRFDRLSQLWTSQDFDRHERSWVPIEHLAQLLRDAHNLL